ncbi:MAG TPA: IS91 family transposase [Bryobacteraceae bacterium]|nr:IS91 family transposase [Bryobacteraceae bacterium]
MSEHRPEVADVFRRYEKEFFEQWGHVLSPQQRRAFEAIRDCRTAALGGHVEYVEQCDTCGHLAISYNSCRNRHCPKCQAIARAKWLEDRQAELLPVPYFHVVFTLPQQIGALALQNAREIYRILFRAASETLLTIAADPKRLGASIGFLAVLHTWGQNLHLHPHLHCVVPGGGLSPDGKRWVSCRKSSFLLPKRVLSARFRNVFVAYLRKAFIEGKLQFHGEMAGLNRPGAFEALCARAAKAKWVVFIKPPFGGPEQVLKYLARYTHRVAISNSRILSIEDGKVMFRWKNYADGNKTRMMTLDAVEFIRRFLLHILPAGFVRIRQYGFLANRARKEKLTLCRTLLNASPPARATDPRKEKPNEKRCPVCATGHMILIHVFRTERLDSS